MNKIYFVGKLFFILLFLLSNNVMGSIQGLDENIKNTDTLSNDIKLVKPLINFNEPDGGFYSQYYREQLNALHCGAIVKNIGYSNATDVYLNIKFLDNGNNQILTYNSDTINLLSSGDSDTLNILQMIDVNVITSFYGSMSIVFNIYSDSSDENIVNNIDTIPFTEFFDPMWSFASRSIVCTDTFSVDKISGFQSGDFIGIVLKNVNPFYFPHLFAGVGVYLVGQQNNTDTFFFKIYRSGNEILSFPSLSNAWPLWNYSYEFSGIGIDPNYDLNPDSLYYIGIELKYTNGNNLPIGIDTSYYHNFESEGIARVGGNWVNIDFVPLIQIVCDPEDIPENNIKREIKVFPSPAKNFITIENVRNSKIELFDINGSLIKLVESTDYIKRLDLSEYKNGSYLLRIINDKEVQNFKIMLIK